MFFLDQERTEHEAYTQFCIRFHSFLGHFFKHLKAQALL